MARQTSIDAYRTIQENGLLSQRRWEVYDILFHHGPLTSTEIIKIFKRDRTVAETGGITTRLSELKYQGVVTEVGEKLNEETGMHQILWDVTEKLPVKFDKPHKEKCRTCKGKGYIVTQQSRLF